LSFRFVKVSLAVVGVLLAGAFAFVYAGVFNVAADDPHWPLTHRVLELVRDRSIAVRARDIVVPALGDPARIARGAEHYDEMCEDCHGEPGDDDGDEELRAGLYPRPPLFARDGVQRSPAEAFWIVKHGLKMTGMPAWGVTHDDESIWGIVAFLETLPLTREQQRERRRGRGGREDDDADHDHRH
jgi:mono/diheme cytochrome c family protein